MATFAIIVAVIQYPFLYPIGGRTLCVKRTMQTADIYWDYLIRMIEGWGRWQMVLSGDKLPPHENAFVIANHRWIVDWSMIFCVAARKGRLGCIKFFVKDAIKYYPGFGWGIYVMDFIFLKRNWERDMVSISKTFEKLKQRRLPFWLVSHVEGTRLTPEKLKASHAFAKKTDLPILNNVLLPRSKGFLATVKALRDGTATAIYDFTLVYNDGKKPPSLSSIVMRRGGKISIHTRRYLISELPKSDEDLHNWILDRWKEKDQLIDQFLKDGHFPNVYNDPAAHLSMMLP